MEWIWCHDAVSSCVSIDVTAGGSGEVDQVGTVVEQMERQMERKRWTEGVLMEKQW